MMWYDMFLGNMGFKTPVAFVIKRHGATWAGSPAAEHGTSQELKEEDLRVEQLKQRLKEASILRAASQLAP